MWFSSLGGGVLSLIVGGIETKLHSMNGDEGKHVFISYVHEDDAKVDALCAALEASQIPYWRDHKSLGPGDAWKAKIRAAIRDGSVVFLACISENSRKKQKSHMNEELALAIEEYRKMPPGRTWLIPVRLDQGDVPDWDLGAGRALSDLNYANLFGDEYTVQTTLLVTTIHGVLGDKKLGPAAMLEAVNQAMDASRVDLMKRLTKELLVNPAQRIELDELVSQEVQRVLKALRDPERAGVPVSSNPDDALIYLATEAQNLWELTQPFCASLQVAARWGNPDALAPWVDGIRAFVQAANKMESGYQSVVQLRHLPGVISMMAASLSCVVSRRFDNLRALIVTSTIRDRRDSKPIALLEATDPYRPFSNQERMVNTLARAALTGKSFAETLEDASKRRGGEYRSPIAEWLHTILRPVFADQLQDDDAYSFEFDRAEVILGVLAQDAASVGNAATIDGRSWGRSRWFGRSVWRAASYEGNAMEDLQHGFTSEGERWGPLRSELFGGDVDRAKVALEKYAEAFTEMGRRQAW